MYPPDVNVMLLEETVGMFVVCPTVIDCNTSNDPVMGVVVLVVPNVVVSRTLAVVYLEYE
jgi:hypothetical protein